MAYAAFFTTIRKDQPILHLNDYEKAKRFNAMFIPKITVTAKELRNQKLNYRDTFSIEYHGLYPILPVLPDVTSEKTQLKVLLIENGFKQTDSGWGNWMNGPRMVNLKFEKGDCICTVYKWYHYHEKMADGAYNLRVTEQLDCNVGRKEY